MVTEPAEISHEGSNDIVSASACAFIAVSIQLQRHLETKRGNSISQGTRGATMAIHLVSLLPHLLLGVKEALVTWFI